MAEWTEGAVARLTELWTQNSCREIAARLYQEGYGEFSRHAVIGKLHRMGLSAKQKTEVHKHTRFDQVPRPKVPVSHHVGAESFKLLHALKRKAKEPQFKPELFACQELPDIEPRNIPLLDLGPNDCRWPTSGALPHTFCGLSKALGSSYCPVHHQLSRGLGTPSERSAHRVERAVA